MTFRKGDAPDYVPAKITIIATTGFACIMTAVLLAYYRWENAKRDRLGIGKAENHVANSEFLDMTDRENGEFRVSFIIFLSILPVWDIAARGGKLERMEDFWLT